MTVSEDALTRESAEQLLGFRPTEATAEGTCHVERYTCSELSAMDT